MANLHFFCLWMFHEWPTVDLLTIKTADFYQCAKNVTWWLEIEVAWVRSGDKISNTLLARNSIIPKWHLCLTDVLRLVPLIWLHRRGEGVPNGNSTQKSQLPLSRLGVNKVGLEGNFFGSYPVQYVVDLLATRVLCDVVASDGGCLQREWEPWVVRFRCKWFSTSCRVLNLQNSSQKKPPYTFTKWNHITNRLHNNHQPHHKAKP